MEQIIREGLARISVPENVFYNPLAKFNRTMGVVFLYTLGSYTTRRDLVVADVMAATGVRGIRYILESMSLNEVFFNDVSKHAYKCILRNLSLNKLKSVSNVTSFNVDRFMSLYTGISFDFIDVDPFGSPLPFISSIFSNLRRREGYLAFTATDLMTLCGVHLDALNRKYGVLMVKTDFCHELAIRILLKNIFLIASYYDYVISPMLATFENQYVRIYVKYSRSPSKIDLNKIGYLLLNGEGYRYVPYTNVSSISLSNSYLLGPIWLDRYFDASFLSLMETNSQKIGEELGLTSEYKPVTKYISRMLIDDTSIPYIYRISKICKKLKISQPSIKVVINSLKAKGYKTYRSFLYPDGIRTEAPLNELIEVLRGSRS